jgi:hypothetical protein
VAKGSAKKPKESKCRGSSAPLEGRDWVRIGGNKWLRDVAEKQGKHIPKEYGERSGTQFDQERAQRIADAEAAALIVVRSEAMEELLPEVEEAEVEADATYGETADVGDGTPDLSMRASRGRGRDRDNDD